MIWRIRERAPFARFGREGARIRTSSLWCSYLPDRRAVPPRVAFAIGRAVGSAVTRNRLRRRLRALLASGPEPAPGWYLIGARPSASELTFAQLAREVEALRRRMPAGPVPDPTAPEHPPTIAIDPGPTV